MRINRHIVKIVLQIINQLKKHTHTHVHTCIDRKCVEDGEGGMS